MQYRVNVDHFLFINSIQFPLCQTLTTNRNTVPVAPLRKEILNLYNALNKIKLIFMQLKRLHKLFIQIMLLATNGVILAFSFMTFAQFILKTGFFKRSV